MDTNKHEFVQNIFSIYRVKEVVVSILEHTTQKRAIERKTKNQNILKDNLSFISRFSWLKNIRVYLCSFVVPIPSVFSVYSVVKNNGAV